MALPPIVLAAEEPVRLFSPHDPAIDVEATVASVPGELEAVESWVAGVASKEIDPETTPRPTTRMDRYEAGDDLDVETLVLKPGEEPTVFVVRALNPREMRVVRAKFPVLEEGADTREKRVQWVEMSLHMARLGLVDVENWDGWTAIAKRDRLFGLECWSEDTAAQVPGQTLLFIGTAILRLSTLDEKKSVNSGSSPGARGGTAARRTTRGKGKARGRSTAKRSANGHHQLPSGR